MRETIQKANSSIAVAGLADSAMFLDYSSKIPSAFQNSYGAEAITDGVVDYPATMRRIFHEYNISAGANRRCLQHYETQPNQCIFTQNLAPFVSTPIFALQVQFSFDDLLYRQFMSYYTFPNYLSWKLYFIFLYNQPRYDQWQLWHVIGLSDAAYINPFGRNVTRMVVERILNSKPYHGAFIESCTHHCTSCSSTGEDSWNGPRIKSTRSPDQAAHTEASAFQRWYNDLQSDSKLRKFLYGFENGEVGSNVNGFINQSQSKQSSGDGKIDLSVYRHAYIQDGKYPCHTCCYCSA